MKHQAHIFPFLWVKGEPIERVKEEIDTIKSSGIDEFVVESRTHPHFLQDEWWSDFLHILDYAKELEMRVWLLDDAHFPTGYANGAVKGHPNLQKEYLYYSAVDLYSEGYELSLHLDLMRKPKRKWSDRKRPQSYYEAIESNRIVSVVAYPLQEDQLLSEQALDLTKYKDQPFLNYTFPKGVWRLFVVYRTTETGGEENYIDMLKPESVRLLIDTIYQPHYQQFKSYFGNVFRGFFSDEPGFGNAKGFAKDEIIGQKDMALPWSDEVETALQAEKAFLPLLWQSTVQESRTRSLRLKYMDKITDCYSRYFTQQLGNWCREHGVEYIGHIIEDNNMHARLGTGAGHYFRAMEGQSMAGIDVISSQISIGGDETFRTNSSQNDGTFYQYCLPKLADSSAQLDCQKANQAFCELYGAYGWQLSIRNMKWIMDSLLVRGITNFVPHAFSMADFPDLDSPPHFHANGFNPQFPLFTELMSSMGKMSNLLSGGTVQAKVAILYHAELEWIGRYMKMQVPSKVLSQSQIDFLYLPTNWLDKARITDKGFSLNGHHFEKIVIPQTEYIPEKVLRFIEKLPNGVVLFLEDYPKGYVSQDQTVSSDFANFGKIPLNQLPTHLSEYKVLDVDGQKAAKIAVRYQIKSGKDYVLVHNESLTERYEFQFKGAIKKYLYRYDVASDSYTLVEGKQVIAPYQMLVYLLTDENISSAKEQDEKAIEPIALNEWRISLITGKEELLTEFQSSDLPMLARDFPNFSGRIRYQTTFELSSLEACSLMIERLFDGGRIYVNGHLVGTLIVPPYQASFKEWLRLGQNDLVIEVATTADRQLVGEKLLINQFEPMEPIGIAGQVLLGQYKH